MNLPLYRCFKVVGAVKIKTLNDINLDDGQMLVPEETGVEPFYISKAYIDKHKPQVGGYFVEYKDGYQSFSPAEAFDGGYEPFNLNETAQISKDGEDSKEESLL